MQLGPYRRTLSTIKMNLEEITKVEESRSTPSEFTRGGYVKPLLRPAYALPPPEPFMVPSPIKFYNISKGLLVKRIFALTLHIYI